MAGNSTGAKKAAETNKKKNPNFYADIGKRSWDNPRSHQTGFALDKDRARAAGRKGGKKTKNDYHKEETNNEGYLTAEEFIELVDPEDPGTSESE